MSGGGFEIPETDMKYTQDTTCLAWSHLGKELPCQIGYCRKDRRDRMAGRSRKKR
jgi:hypothetical protein